MKAKALGLAGMAGTLFIASSATANFAGATIVTVATGVGPGSNSTQYSVELIFDHPADIINSVGGAAGMQSLIFNTNDPGGLRNTGMGGHGPDIFNPYGPPGSVDSYVRIGADPMVTFTPNFLSTMGGDSGNHVAGTNWSVADDGYFRAGGVAVGAAQISIANFVIGDGFGIGYQGLVGWVNNTTGGGGLSVFSVNNKPAPGALALLGLAGLAGSRRRRR